MMPPLVGLALLVAGGFFTYRVIHDAEKKRVVKTKVDDALDLGLCDDFEGVGAWAKERGWNVWYVDDKPVSVWKAPRPEFLAEKAPIAYSVKDCGFYWWDASSQKWLEHTAADSDFKQWSSAQ